MSTVTRPSLPRRGSITPASVCTRMLSPRARPLSATYRAKQRAPLPHCSTSPPSALWITYSKSTPGAGLGRTDRTWSAPTPKWRSARRRDCSGERPPRSRVSSSTTKSLPAPCILVKRMRMRRLSAQTLQRAIHEEQAVLSPEALGLAVDDERGCAEHAQALRLLAEGLVLLQDRRRALQR